MITLKDNIINNKLEKLYQEHANLENQLNGQYQSGYLIPIEIQRLKKRKLFLKDQIAILKAKMHPNIIA